MECHYRIVILGLCWWVEKQQAMEPFWAVVDDTNFTFAMHSHRVWEVRHRAHSLFTFIVFNLSSKFIALNAEQCSILWLSTLHTVHDLIPLVFR